MCSSCASYRFKRQWCGSGGNSNKPLELVGSVPSVDESVGTEFSVEFEFNKNVANVDASVLESNLNCFSLYDADGNEVDITAEVGDVQVDPDAKNFITVKSAQALSPGTYELVISGALESNSGVTLGEDISLQYTVADSVENTENVDNNTDVVDNNTTDNNNNITDDTEQSSSATTWIIIIVVIIIVILIIVLVSRRKK